MAKVTQRTELGPLRALPAVRQARIERGTRLGLAQCAQLTPVVPQNVVRPRDVSRDDDEDDSADRTRILGWVADSSTCASRARQPLCLRQYAQLCMDCRRPSSSCGLPKLVPLFNESGKLVPTSRRWGRRHRRARLRPGFFYLNRGSRVMEAGLIQSPGMPGRFNCAVDGVLRRHRSMNSPAPRQMRDSVSRQLNSEPSCIRVQLTGYSCKPLHGSC